MATGRVWFVGPSDIQQRLGGEQILYRDCGEVIGTVAGADGLYDVQFFNQDHATTCQASQVR